MNKTGLTIASARVFATVLLGTTALTTAAYADGTAAQQTAQAETPKPADGQGDTAKKDKVEKVTVTAQRRKQRILDVPYNITAVSGEEIERNQVRDAAELMRSIPGVSVVDRGERNGSVVNGIRIRGLNVDSSALGDYSVSAASTVSTYVNDTPIFANFLLKDIERVEVLKGPQGTLYGSGALGGTVRYIMRAPEFDEMTTKVSGTVSQVNGSDGVGYSADAVLNVPLSDTLAFRVSATRFDYPGVTDYVNLYKLDSKGVPVIPGSIFSPAATFYKKEDADTFDGWFARAALKWQPSAQFDVTLNYMGQWDKFGGRRAEALGNDGFGRAYQDHESGAVILEPGSRDVYMTSLEANLDLGFATLTSSSSYYDHHGSLVSDNTGFYAQNGWLKNFYYNYPRPLAEADRTYGDKAFIQEVRLVSNTDGPIDYVLGAFYENQRQFGTQDSFLRGFKQWWNAAYPLFAAAVVGDQDYLYRRHEHFTDAAVYGELTWHVTDVFQLTGGFRSFKEDSQTRVFQTTGLYSSIIDTSDSIGKESKSKTLFKGNFSWNFEPDNMLYGTVAQGFRRGGSNGVPLTGNFAESPAWQNYNPDDVVDYEIGLKGRLDNIVYNVDAFYVDWRDPQLNTSTTNWGFFAVQNGKSATTKGIEAQIDGTAGNWHYGLGYTFTDATLGANLISADGVYQINKDGARLPGAPEHMLTGALDYSTPLEGDTFLRLHLDGYYQSETEDTIFSADVFKNNVTGPNPYFGQPKYFQTMDGFTLWNAAATYSIGKLDATLWVKNIFDDPGVTGVYTLAYMGTSPAQNYYGNASKEITALPRTFGLTVSYAF